MLLQILNIIVGLCVDTIIFTFCLIVLVSIICHWKNIPINNRNKSYSLIYCITTIFLLSILLLIEWTIILPGHHLFFFLNSIH